MFRSEEQRRFNQIIERHIALQDAPLLLEGGTGIGKTRAYLAAVADTDKRVAIVLPSNHLIDQLLASDDLVATGIAPVAYRRADLFETRAEYLANREAAMAARVMICTSASVIIDQRLRGGYNGALERDYLIFDEADQLPEVAALQRDRQVSAYEFRDAGVEVANAREAITALLAKRNLDPELRGRAMIIAEALAEPAWYQKADLDDEGGVSLYHDLPGRLLAKVANQANVAFVSATLQIAQSFDDFKTSLGIKDHSRLSAVIEPRQHGDIRLFGLYEQTAAEVVSEAARPCLVATASHADAQTIARDIPGSVVRSHEEDLAEALSRVPPDGVLVTAGAWAGLDTPFQWASIVIPRVPFPRPKVLNDTIQSHYVVIRNMAVRRMRQVIGRGLRSPEASCDIYVLDERHERLGGFVPERFLESWQEGEVEERLKKERKRNRQYRPRVFEVYGTNCMACGYVPPQTDVMDVHHLDPIAEGERKTTIEDLVVLCPTCHRHAHIESPPIPMERLKVLVS